MAMYSTGSILWLLLFIFGTQVQASLETLSLPGLEAKVQA